MKRFVLLGVLISISLICSCASLTMDNVKAIPVFQKTYYVVFEDKPEIADEGVYASEFKIGKVSSQEPGPEGMVIAKIAVQNEHADLIRDNVVFYISEGKMTLETVGENGKPLEEGAKILGFTGRASLTWFKTKNAVSNISNAAFNKAEKLYNRVVGTGSE